MKHISLALLMVLVAGIIHAQTYITHVNVIDVVNLKTNADETVVINNKKIVEVDSLDNWRNIDVVINKGSVFKPADVLK